MMDPRVEDAADDRPWRAEDVLAEVKRRRASGESDSGSTSAALREYFEAGDDVRLRLDPPDPHATAWSALTGGATGDGPSAAAATESVTPPVEPPHHFLLRRLGKGGFGEVWLARQTVTEHYRACKLIPADRSLELDGLKRLRQKVPPHPGLFPVEDVGVADGWLYALMPLADNAIASNSPIGAESYSPMTLEIHRERRGRLSAQDAASVVAEIADALAHLHEHGITHGDIKPANILRYNGRWAIADYGLLRDLGEPTGEGHTPHYCPPEGPGSPAADQFALGVVLFELLTGWHPGSLDRYKVTPKEHLGLEDRAEALRAIIVRATASHAEDRFGSVAALRDALRTLDEPRDRRATRLIGGLAVAATVALTAIAVFAWRGLSSAPIEVEAFEVRHERFDGVLYNMPLGMIGPESDAALLGDEVTLRATLSRPGYAYLLTLDTDGTATLRSPASPGVPPQRLENILFPADPTATYHLSDGPGLQGFLLVVSDDPLPAWNEYAARHGSPTWAALSDLPSAVWVYDGLAVGAYAQGGATRGEIRPRSGVPQPVADIVAWAAPQKGKTTARMVAFPVRAAPANAVDE